MFKSPFNNPLPPKSFLGTSARALTFASVLALMVLPIPAANDARSEEHTSELQSQ